MHNLTFQSHWSDPLASPKLLPIIGSFPNKPQKGYPNYSCLSRNLMVFSTFILATSDMWPTQKMKSTILDLTQKRVPEMTEHIAELSAKTRNGIQNITCGFICFTTRFFCDSRFVGLTSRMMNTYAIS